MDTDAHHWGPWAPNPSGEKSSYIRKCATCPLTETKTLKGSV